MNFIEIEKLNNLNNNNLFNYIMIKPFCYTTNNTNSNNSDNNTTTENQVKEWLALNKWNNKESIKNSLENKLVNILIAKDGQTFLKNELCDIIEENLYDIIDKIYQEEEQEEQEDKEEDKEEEDKKKERYYCRLYLDTNLNLLNDINLEYIESLFLNNERRFDLKNCGVWISSKLCITPLHYDLCHGLLIQISGRKRFIYASPDDTLYLYQNKDPYSKNQTSSVVNLTKWMEGDVNERRRYPMIDEAQWYIIDLYPGDILYTPPGWWHYVVSLDQSVSLLLPYDMSENEHLHPLQSL